MPPLSGKQKLLLVSSALIVLALISIASITIVGLRQIPTESPAPPVLDVSYTVREGGAEAGVSPGYAPPEFTAAGLSPETAVMGPEHLRSVYERVAEDLSALRTRTNWREELAHVATRARGRTSASYLTVLTVINDYSDVPLANEASLRSFLTDRDARMTQVLFDEVMPEFSAFMRALAQSQDVARPFQIDGALRSITPAGLVGPGFPSVEIAQLYMAGELLADVGALPVESVQPAIDATADAFVIEGLHFRPDVVAAERVVAHYSAQLRETSSYQTLHRAASREWSTGRPVRPE